MIDCQVVLFQLRTLNSIQRSRALTTKLTANLKASLVVIRVDQSVAGSFDSCH